jgi:hypothetical protein
MSGPTPGARGMDEAQRQGRPVLVADRDIADTIARLIAANQKKADPGIEPEPATAGGVRRDRTEPTPQ